MFSSWWAKKPEPVQTADVDDENTELLNVPETPATVFAARALKSAIFGTPAPPDDTIYDAVDQEKSEVEKKHTSLPARSLSPTKPAGILLTPGTAATRRKTVSFGNEVVDQAKERPSRVKRGSKSGIPDDCPGKFPSPWVPKTEVRKLRRSMSLTEAFESVKAEKASTTRTGRGSFDSNSPFQTAKDPQPASASAGPSVKREDSARDKDQRSTKDVAPDNDTTVDLNEPQSTSGRFWKNEYEQYHEESLAEMKKLIEYKDVAKSFAQTKDTQAMTLVVQLKDEQKKVADMEHKISRLTKKIARLGKDGNSEEASPTLVKDLARQTALTLQYKAQVAEFQAALEANGISVDLPKENIVADTSLVSPRTEQTILDTRHELRKARQQLKNMDTLRGEVMRLRGELSEAEKVVTKVGADNAKLTQELLHTDLRLEKHLEKCSMDNQQSDKNKDKSEEAIKTLQNDYDNLKELMRSSRRDTDRELKRRQDQLIDLRKKIASIRGSDATVKELQQALQKKDLEHERVVSELKKQIEELKANRMEPAGPEDQKKVLKEEFTLTPREWYPPKASPVRESQIPIATSPNISRPLKTVSRSSLLDESFQSSRVIRHRTSQPALSDIINNANVDTLPPHRYGPVQHTPRAPNTPTRDRVNLQQVKSPELTLPCFESTQIAEPYKNIHARNCHASPRPSMFNIASSPPKAALMRPQSSNGLSRQRSNNDLGAQRLADANASRLPVQEPSKVRVPLPPERAAAAKARLEAKAAEKRKAQALAGKENVKA